MNYTEAVEYLYSLTNFEVEPAKRYDPALYDRARLIELLARLGNPHQQFASVHVAGSKGKGSTAAMLAGVLQAAGYRTGLYTSPHLNTFRERVQINRQLIPEETVAALVEEIRSPAAQIPGLTTFELITVLAFLYFARARVEIAVVEVGMGGRLDATNVLSPLITAITSVSLEHTTFLGGTLAEIAGEKAGIVKPGVPLVLAPQRPEAQAVVVRICEERNAPLIRVDELWAVQVRRRSPAGSEFFLKSKSPDRSWCSLARALSSGEQPVRLPLIGDHQIENALVALTATGLLASRGFPCAGSAIRSGLATVRWPGRMEVIADRPLVIVDGAHNAASARALLAGLRDYLGRRRIRLVYGSLADKDVKTVLSILLPAVEEVIVVAPRFPRAMPAAQVAHAARELGYAPVAAPSVTEGIQLAIAHSDPNDLICVTGSLYVVGECLACSSP
jgi:dihydrofolate synthase/folylpolyglutamate synthase